MFVKGVLKVSLLALLMAGCVANNGKPVDGSNTSSAPSNSGHVSLREPSPSESTSASVGSAPSLPKEPVDRPNGPYKVTLLAGGTELEFLGEVTRESMAALTKAIIGNQGIKVIQLTSPGGDLHAANKVADLISERQLTTFVPMQCVSACSTLFLGGVERIVAEGASLGFHSLSMPGAGSGSKLERVANEAMGKDIVSHGVDPAFAAKVTATPHESMWYPSHAEMLKARAITGTAPQSAFAQPSVGPDPVALLDWSYLNDPVVWGMKAAYPAAYEKLREKLYNDIVKRGFHDGRQGLVLSGGYGDAIERALGETSDAALLAYYEAVRNRSAFLDDLTPGACIDSDKARMGMSRDEADLLESLNNLVTIALVQVFEAVPGSKEKAPTRSEYNAALKSLAQSLVQSGVIKASDKKIFDKGDSDDARFCKVYVELLTAALRSGPDTRDKALRGIQLYQ